MIQKIVSFGALQQFNNQQKVIQNYSNYTSTYSNTISFKGMSQASQYKNSFEYLASQIISRNKKWGINGSMLSATNISKALESLFKLNKVFGPFMEAQISKIKWRNYIPQDVREYCVNKINDARAHRLKQWKDFLENPDSAEDSKKHKKVVQEIKGNNALKFVIWHAVNSELKANNRHIPVPLDLTALEETVKHFKDILPVFRAVTCASSSFLDMYTHRLRDNLLMQKGLGDKQNVWVKIPSAKRDPDNLESNIEALEILSYKNWCTRSSVDKAADALADGDFYIYLKRDDKQVWHPTLGMASCRGKIDQIQGKDNNNFIPLTEVENIKKFLADGHLKCQSGVSDEGPKAMQQIMIAEKLIQHYPIVGKTLSKALTDKDFASVFKILGHNVETTEGGLLNIETYRPQFLLDSRTGISVPYAFMAIEEDELLKKVEKINGDFILHNRGKVYDSTITTFPPNLKTVTGRIICTREQYKLFKEDMLKVVSDPSMIKVH